MSGGPYPPRRVIQRHEFSVRHMILEELKFRLFGADLSDEERRLLAWIADGVMVEAKSRKFVITLYELPVLEMDQARFRLYVRGDSEAALARQQEHGGEEDGLPDPFLESNRKRIREVVSELIWKSQQARLGPQE